MKLTDLARLMFRRAVTQRAENPPNESTKLRVETLEDRNAPGSLLGELLAAARGEAAPNPLDQLGWLFPSATHRPVADVPTPVPTIRISAGIALAQAEAVLPQLVGPQSAVGGSAASVAD